MYSIIRNYYCKANINLLHQQSVANYITFHNKPSIRTNLWNVWLRKKINKIKRKGEVKISGPDTRVNI